uniref:Uncharacterized protein n=1 Tax=Biomphalaria glabrata TaxID=6526 RepID=A0A2C9KIW1_BIOGL
MRSLILIVLVAAIGFAAAECTESSYVGAGIPECLETYFESIEKFFKLLEDLILHAKEVFGADIVIEIIKKILKNVLAGGDFWNSITDVDGLTGTFTKILPLDVTAALTDIATNLQGSVFRIR